uniref:(California timema) hypothetical protein n=1 Tax=Timema californicum TaxID=61474 RepID=A0A7R9J1C4_TIMCA|nr:unnamed protein product [Timema californicum]
MSREFEFILRKGSARNGTDHAIFEEERLKLEERFAVMIRSCREEEEVRLLALRDRYEKFLRDDRRRRDRNERILQTLDRIENRSVVLAAKTDRLRLLRRHYETYVAHVYPSWKPQGSDSTPVRSHVIQRPNLPTAMAVSNITNIASPRTSVPLYPITDVKTAETITSTHLEGVNSQQILPTSQVSGLLAHSARPDINIKDPEGKPLMHTHAIGSSVLKYIAIANRQGVLPEKPPFLGPDIHDNSPTSYKANHYIDQAADLLKFNRDEAQPSTFVKGLHSNLGSTNDISKLNVDSKLGNSVDFEMEQNTSKDLLNVSLSDDGIIQEETDMANPSLPPSKDHKAEDSNLKVRFDTSGGPSELAGRLKDIEVNKSTRHSSDIINSQHKLSNVHKEGLSALKPTQFVPELDIDCGGGGDTSRDVKEIPGLSLNQRNVESYHLNSNADLSRRGEPSMSTNEDYSGINVGSSHHEGDRHTTANKECLESKKDAKNNDPKMLAVMQEKRMLKEPPINNFHNAENIKRTSNLGNIIVQSNEMDKDWQVSSVQKEIVGKPSQYQQEVDPKLFNLNKNELYENASDQKLQRQKTEENQYQQLDEQGQYQQLDDQGQYQQLDNQNQHPIGEQIHYQVDGQGEYVLDEKGQCLPLDHQGQYQHTIDTTNQPDDQGQNKLDSASELQQQEVFESEETEYHQPQDNAEDIDQNSVTQGPVEQIVDVIGIQSSELPKETLQQYRSLLGVTAEPSSEMTGYSDGDEVEDHLAALVMQHEISSVDTQMSPGTTNLKDIHQTKNIDAIQGKMSALSSGGLSLQMMDVLGGLGQDLASDDSSEIQGPPRNITQGSGGIKPIIQSNLTQEESVLPRLQGSGNTICRDTQLLEQPNLVTTVETKPSEDIKASHKSDSDKPKTFKPVSKKLPDLTKMLESDSDSLQLDVNATLSNVDSDDFDFSSETQ